MKTRVIGITETSRDVWRVTFNGSVLGDSRGYDRAGALAEAKRFVARNGGVDGDWGPTGWEEMRNVLDPALEPPVDDQPILSVEAPANPTSKFWQWFDATAARALESEDGKAFAAAGFKLDHTGGGCTAWRRPIEGTGWSVFITTDESGHLLTAEDLACDGHYCVFVAHDDECLYTLTSEYTEAAPAIQRAHVLTATVAAGNVDTLGIVE